MLDFSASRTFRSLLTCALLMGGVGLSNVLQAQEVFRVTAIPD